MPTPKSISVELGTLTENVGKIAPCSEIPGKSPLARLVPFTLKGNGLKSAGPSLNTYGFCTATNAATAGVGVGVAVGVGLGLGVGVGLAEGVGVCVGPGLTVAPPLPQPTRMPTNKQATSAKTKLRFFTKTSRI